ncbi:MAG: DUF2934 domain-containing protein [Steroidobacteraceae bacterium]
MATRRTTEPVRTPESAQASEKAAQRRPAPIKPAATSAAASGVSVSESARRAMIEQSAYLRAERRGFAPGDEVEDWLAAETEVDALLKAGRGRPPM